MGATFSWPGTPDGTQRHGPLLLAVALHASLIAAAWHGMQSSLQQPAPHEVVISLLSLASAAAPTLMAPQPVAVAPPEPSAPATPIAQPVHALTPAAVMPVLPVSPQQASAPNPAPAAPVMHEAPAAVATGAPPADVRSVTAPAGMAPGVTNVPPVTRGPITVSGVDYLSPPTVEYPISARRAGLEGRVMLRLLIDEKGQPQRADVQQSSGHPRLDEAARAAALRALFKPHLEDGQPMPVYALVPISFSLK